MTTIIVTIAIIAVVLFVLFQLAQFLIVRKTKNKAKEFAGSFVEKGSITAKLIDKL